MKMEGVSDLVNGRNEVTKPREVPKTAQPSPRDIGREFVRQYYTMLSERPQDVYRFYSHESYFVHDSEQPVQGQQKIQRAIERLAFVNCKARIHTVTGTATMNNGLVIQVCGELTISDIPKRRFLQTFILCPQTPKKYYVLNDVFQWLDHAFGDPIPGQQLQEMSHIGGGTKEDSPGVINGDQTASLNGQHQNAIGSSGDDEQRATDLSDEAINISEEEHDEVEPTNEHDYVVRAEEDHHNVINSEKPIEQSEEKSTTVLLEQEQTVAPSAQQSWAKMVSSSASQTAPQYPRSTVPTQSGSRGIASSQPVSSNVQSAQGNVTGYHQKEPDSYSTGGNQHVGIRYQGDNNCKLYIGNITRSICPDKTETPEAEIKTALEQYGSVASVKVPPKAIDKSVYHAFAFIVMKTPEGASNVFKAARKDQERGTYFLNMKLNSFGFDGEVTLSTQKNDRMRTPFLHRNGPPLQGVSRGSHTRSGMGARGTNRSLYSRQYGGGSEHRHPGNVHAQHE